MSPVTSIQFRKCFIVGNSYSHCSHDTSPLSNCPRGLCNRGMIGSALNTSTSTNILFWLVRHFRSGVLGFRNRGRCVQTAFLLLTFSRSSPEVKSFVFIGLRFEHGAMRAKVMVLMPDRCGSPTSDQPWYENKAQL